MRKLVLLPGRFFNIVITCLPFFFSNCNIVHHSSTEDFTRYVDPFIGTGFHGHVFLGANVPFGAVQLGPVNLSQGWDWCSGYHYSDSTIFGFAHTHLSGTGIGDLGDVMLMPVVGNVKLAKGIAGNQQSGYYSLFSHNDEIVAPGYYAVLLKRYGIRAEMTATERVGFHQYTYPAADSAKVIFDLESGIGWDKSADTYIKKTNDTTIIGFRLSEGWAKDQRLYFTAVFSKPIKAFQVYDSTQLKDGEMLQGKKIRAVVLFSTTANEKLKVKVGISPVSIENAAKNIMEKFPDWDFDKVKTAANSGMEHRTQ